MQIQREVEASKGNKFKGELGSLMGLVSRGEFQEDMGLLDTKTFIEEIIALGPEMSSALLTAYPALTAII